jgi:hypothetical protein
MQPVQPGRLQRRSDGRRCNELYSGGEKGYYTEYDNFAPNVGIAWQPNRQDGLWRKILGDPNRRPSVPVRHVV